MNKDVLISSYEKMDRVALRRAIIDYVLLGGIELDVYTAADPGQLHIIFAIGFLGDEIKNPSDETKQTLLAIMNAHEPTISVREGYGGIEAGSNEELIEEVILSWRAEHGLDDEDDEDGDIGMEAIKSVARVM